MRVTGVAGVCFKARTGLRDESFKLALEAAREHAWSGATATAYKECTACSRVPLKSPLLQDKMKVILSPPRYRAVLYRVLFYLQKTEGVDCNGNKNC